MLKYTASQQTMRRLRVGSLFFFHLYQKISYRVLVVAIKVCFSSMAAGKNVRVLLVTVCRQPHKKYCDCDILLAVAAVLL